jgi:hypothetical protein
VAESWNSGMSRGSHITARQWQGKHISAATDSDATTEDAVFSMLPISTATNQYATIKEPSEAIFSIQSMPRP